MSKGKIYIISPYLKEGGTKKPIISQKFFCFPLISEKFIQDFLIDEKKIGSLTAQLTSADSAL